MSTCLLCGGKATGRPDDAGTCGAFSCLHRRFCGDDAPSPVTNRALPWNNPSEVRRIAVVRPGQLGDLLLALPGLRALRRGFPAAEITLIGQPWAQGFANRFPWIDRLLILRTRPGDADPEAREALAAFVEEARAYRYDLVIQLQGNGQAYAGLALDMKGRATVGFCADREREADFHLLLSMSPNEPEILRVMRLAQALGARAAGIRVDVPILPEDERELQRVQGLAQLLHLRPAIAMHPGARPPARRWPLDSFWKLATLLHRRYGAVLLLVGGPEETSLGEDLGRRLAGPWMNLAGKLSLGGLAALLARVDLFVGNDSGPAQMASATAPRSLRIFGPANRHRWAPMDQTRHRIIYRQVECSPCDHFECPIDHRCLEWVTVEEVMAGAEALLQESRLGSNPCSAGRAATPLPPPPSGPRPRRGPAPSSARASS